MDLKERVKMTRGFIEDTDQGYSPTHGEYLHISMQNQLAIMESLLRMEEQSKAANSDYLCETCQTYCAKYCGECEPYANGYKQALLDAKKELERRD